MARAVHSGEIASGVLVVSPDSSRTITGELLRDLRRLSDGRTDSLSDIGEDLRDRLMGEGFPVARICAQLSIVIVHAIEGDALARDSAINLLDEMARSQESASAAWDALYQEAGRLVERRGRWTARSLITTLSATNIEFVEENSPAALLSSLRRWVFDVNATFSVPGCRLPISIDNAWIPLHARVLTNPPREEVDLAAALDRYHRGATEKPGAEEEPTKGGEWIGRFYLRAMVIAGPGLGKSTLMTKLARLYARDGYPVLKVRLRSVAAAMRAGRTFTDAVFAAGLDGFASDPAVVRSTRLTDLVLLADGLDECHPDIGIVAAALRDFAAGHPGTRIIVTTRPVGYTTSALTDWRHYELERPNLADASDHVLSFMRAILPPNENAAERKETITAALDWSGAGDVVSGSPSLLGMAAVVLASGGELGRSRSQLYGNFMRLIMDTPNPRETTSPPSFPILSRMGDLLGKELTSAPLDAIDKVLERCARHLAASLDVSHLCALDIANQALRHLEDVGLVERLHHSAVTLLTFTHKTLTEYAAARWIATILLEEERAAFVAARLTNPAWAEPLLFASTMGLGEVIVSRMLNLAESGNRPLLVRSLELLSQPGCEVPLHLLERAVSAAASAIGRDEDPIEVASALGDLAWRRATVVCPTVRHLLVDPRPEVRLAAWATVAEAGGPDFDARGGMGVVTAFAMESERHLGGGLFAGAVVGGSSASNLLNRLALGTVRALAMGASDEEALEFAETTLSQRPFDTVGFQKDLATTMGRPGWVPPVLRSLYGGSFLEEMLLPASALQRAASAATRTLLTALRDHADGISVLSAEGDLQLAAFVDALGFLRVGASDVYAWTRPFDSDAIREVIGTMVRIAPVDTAAVAASAVAALSRLDTEPSTTAFDVLGPQVSLDLPEPDWFAVQRLRPDREKLIRALNHRSEWFVQAAANLLFYSGGVSEEELRTLLGRLQGNGLIAAAHLAVEFGTEVSAELLIERIAGSVVLRYEQLFVALGRSRPEWSGRLAEALRTGLVSRSALAAEAAADLVFAYVEAGAPVDAAMLRNAFTHWLTHEKPYPREGGVVPNSPRSVLLQSLIQLSDVGDGELLAFCRDERSDVAGVATGALLAHLKISEEARDLLVSWIIGREVPPGLLARALRERVPFSSAHIASLMNLLEDRNAEWRLAACGLLEGGYLQENLGNGFRRAMRGDPHWQVRAAARRISGML